MWCPHLLWQWAGYLGLTYLARYPTPQPQQVLLKSHHEIDLHSDCLPLGNYSIAYKGVICKSHSEKLPTSLLNVWTLKKLRALSVFAPQIYPWLLKVGANIYHHRGREDTVLERDSFLAILDLCWFGIAFTLERESEEKKKKSLNNSFAHYHTVQIRLLRNGIHCVF